MNVEEVTVIDPMSFARIVLVLLGAFVSLFGQSTPYCAFEVYFEAPEGRPIAHVPVALLRADKTTFSESLTDARGIARVCDAPLEYLDIAVGVDVCGSVIVRHLPPNWPDSRRVHVTYAETPCNHVAVPPTCRVLLRIRDAAGNPVMGARFEPARPGTRGMDVSDAFGRVYRTVDRGSSLCGVVVKDAVRSAPISERCTDQENVELRVVLRK